MSSIITNVFIRLMIISCISLIQVNFVYSFLTFGDKGHSSHSRSHQRIIYIDLGTNCGASIDAFVSRAITHSHNNSKLFDITGDGSSVSGDDFGRVDHLNKTDFHVIAVEANDRFTQSILGHKDKLMANKVVKSFTLYNGTAISTKSGITTFTFDDGKNGMGSSGASLNNDSYSVIDGKKITVKMMDICELFRVNRITARDYVSLKIDIEGTEYDVVRKLIVSGMLVKYVDQIAIEWHHTNSYALGFGGVLSKVTTDEDKKKREQINQKYVKYYEHLMFMFSDDEFKHIKIFNWG